MSVKRLPLVRDRCALNGEAERVRGTATVASARPGKVRPRPAIHLHATAERRV